MDEVTEKLFEAFRRDHATLGRGLHAIATHLRGGEWKNAVMAAEALDRAAGAHIAFEEQDFYPALGPFLDRQEVDALYREHNEGADTVRAIEQLNAEGGISEAQRADLLRRIEEMEHHVSECGELFGAMGGLTSDEKSMLLERLDAWRAKAPRWTELGRKE